MYENRVGAYRKNDIVTADPKRLVLMCYDALITNLKLVKARYLEEEYEAKAKAITKSMNVINVLMEGLNFEKGGQIAKNLDAIYAYMLRRIIYAEAHKDLTVFDELINIAEELGSAWKEIFDNGKGTTGQVETMQSSVPSPRGAVSVA